jgi:hypothetical protein
MDSPTGAQSSGPVCNSWKTPLAAPGPLFYESQLDFSNPAEVLAAERAPLTSGLPQGDYDTPRWRLLRANALRSSSPRDRTIMRTTIKNMCGGRAAANKMINAFGVPISAKSDAKMISNYLVANYGDK